MNINEVPQPLNARERLLHAIVVRQNILIEQLSSIIEHIAKKDHVALENNQVTEQVIEAKPAPRKRSK